MDRRAALGEHVLALVSAPGAVAVAVAVLGVEREAVEVIAEGRILGGDGAAAGRVADLEPVVGAGRLCPVAGQPVPLGDVSGAGLGVRLDEGVDHLPGLAVDDLDPDVGRRLALEDVGDLRRAQSVVEGLVRDRLGRGELELAGIGDLARADDLQRLVLRRLRLDPVGASADRPGGGRVRHLDLDHGRADRARCRRDPAARGGGEADLLDPVEAAAAELDLGAGGGYADVGAALEADHAGELGRIRGADTATAGSRGDPGAGAKGCHRDCGEDRFLPIAPNRRRPRLHALVSLSFSSLRG